MVVQPAEVFVRVLEVAEQVLLVVRLAVERQVQAAQVQRQVLLEHQLLTLVAEGAVQGLTELLVRGVLVVEALVLTLEQYLQQMQLRLLVEEVVVVEPLQALQIVLAATAALAS
jgi:hypothetical protein